MSRSCFSSLSCHRFLVMAGLLWTFMSTMTVTMVSSASIKFSTGTCQTLPAAVPRTINPCVGVVTYPFYLGQSQTLAGLQAQANNLLNSSLLIQYPDFASQYIRHVCVHVYLKCSPNVNLQNVTTYNKAIYINYPVPFQKPCQSMCQQMMQSAPAFIKMLWGFTPTFCAKTFDYSAGDVGSPFPLFYDNSVNSSNCFVPTLTSVGGPVETYAGQVCKGVVNTFVVPPANKLDASLSVTQLPGATQHLLESALKTKLKSLPSFVKADCLLSLKQYICSPLFITPQVVTLQQGLVYSNMQTTLGAFLENSAPGVTTSTTLKLPSYPHHSLCTNYSTVCQDFVKLATALAPQCDSVVPGNAFTIRQFPTQKQVVVAMPIVKTTNAGTIQGTLSFPTDANTNIYYNAAAYGTYEPDCPAGFVVPEHPDDPNVQWASGTGCANACKSSFWTHSEWEKMIRMGTSMPIIGTVFGMIMLIYLFVTKEAYNYYLITIYTLINFVASSQSWRMANQHDFYSRFCYDNAINQQQEYGSSPCVTQAITLSYTILASAGCILAMCLQWVLQTYKLKHIFYHPAYYVLQFLVIFIFPVPLVVYPGVHQEFGFFKLVPYCMIMQKPWSPKNSGPGLSGLPVFIAYVIAYLTFLGGWITKFFIPAPDRHPEDDLLHTVERQCDPHVMIVFFSALIFIPYIVANALSFLYYDDFVDSYQTWSKCVFNSYDGTDESYLNACGDHASYRPTIVLSMWQTFTLTGNMILVTPVFIFFHLFIRDFDILPLLSRSSFFDIGTSVKYSGGGSTRLNSVRGKSQNTAKVLVPSSDDQALEMVPANVDVEGELSTEQQPVAVVAASPESDANGANSEGYQVLKTEEKQVAF